VEEGDQRMSSVDDRIVNMQFNNKQFTQGAAESQKSLQSLDQTVAGMGKSSSGLASLGDAADGVSGKFSALRIAGITAVATIASKATAAGLNMLKGFTVGPIIDGFHEYQTNLNSIQTIMANTGKKVGVVNKYLNQLNHYSDQTIYNFSQMADSIGKFTAAGVPLKEATSSIKGMANMAALSGSNVQQLNTAMYQMSQALSTGTIRLMDWNSLANAGMGGSNIRKALMATNRTLGDHGKAMDDAIKKAGSFRDSLQAGWLTADTFNKTMKVMAGRTTAGGKSIAYTVEQLKGMGYSEDAAKQLHKLSQASIDSATKIKTFSQLIDVVKESIGSGWGKIFQDLFGNFNQASKLWTGVGNSINNTISKIFNGVDKMLVGWRKLGGYQDLWNGFGNIFKTIGNLIAPFIAAFKAIAPATGTAGSGLAKVTSAFATFTGWMEKVSENAKYLTPILVAIFGSFKQIGSVVGAVIHGLAPLAPLLRDISKAAGNLAAQGSEIASGLLSGLLKGLDPRQIQAAVTRFAKSIIAWIKDALGIHSPSTEMIPVGFNLAAGIAEGIINGIGAVASALGKVISVIFDHVSKLFSGFTAMDWASLINAALTGVLIHSLTSFVKQAGQIKDSIAGMFNSIGDSLKAWQQSLKAKMILEIAIAVGILGAALIALSFVDPKKLAVGLGAITALLGTLSGTLLALSKIESDKQMAILATSLLLISTAMINLAGAVAIFGNMDMKTLEKGLGAMAIALGLMVGATLAFAGIQGKLASAGVAIVLMSVAMTALAGAVAAFGVQDMKQLAKGLGAMGIALGLVTASLIALSGNSKGVLAAAASIAVVSGSLSVLASAVFLFGKMDMKTLAKGFGAVAIGLGLMVGALLLMSGNSAGVVAAAGAMAIMAGALNLLVTVVLALGAAPWQVVAKGLGFVAAALGIFLLAGAAAILVAPGLEALGVAVALLGAGMLAAGLGMAAFGTGFALMAATGTAGIAVMIAAIHAFLALLPEIAIQIAAALIAFLKVIANSTTEIRKAFDKIFANIIGVITDNIPVIVNLVVKFIAELLKGITRLIPQFGKLISQLIKTGLDVIKKAVPQYVDAGLTIIQGVLDGFARHLPKILDSAGDLVVEFIRGLGRQANKIVDAAGQTILTFLQGVDKAVNKYSRPITQEGVQIAKDLVSGIVSGLLSSVSLGKISSAVSNLADHIPGWAKKMLGINSPSKVMIPIGRSIGEGVAVGINDSIKLAVSAASRMANAVIAAGNKSVLKAQRAATAAQKKAYAIQARADLKAQQARDAQHYANQHKKDKEAQKRANQLKKQADKQQKAADKAQKAADAASTHVQNVQTFAEADAHGKGDIRNQQAVALADRANKQLAKANAEAARARQLMKTNRKAGRAMLEQARKDAKAAKDLAKQAEAAHKDANRYYASEVDARIKQMEADAAADKKAAEDQAKFDAADTQGKHDILMKRADADEARAKKAKAEAARLIKQAKKLADTDAAKAMKLLDKADKLTQTASDAADQAKQERDQAEQLLSEGGTTTTSPTTVTPSASILEDAAKAVDRYTESLHQAEEFAMAQQGPVQFVQNNYSPTALNADEIYRQNKNLLSTAELKMGVNPRT
jgi:hypothetical protein